MGTGPLADRLVAFFPLRGACRLSLVCFPLFVLLWHAASAGAVAGFDGCGFVGEENALCCVVAFVDPASCVWAIEAAVDLEFLVAAQGAFLLALERLVVLISECIHAVSPIR